MRNAFGVIVRICEPSRDAKDSGVQRERENGRKEETVWMKHAPGSCKIAPSGQFQFPKSPCRTVSCSLPVIVIVAKVFLSVAQAPGFSRLGHLEKQKNKIYNSFTSV